MDETATDTSKEYKKARTTGKRLFTRKANNLRSQLNDDVQPDQLREDYEELVFAFEELVIRHERVLNELEDDDAIEEEEGYLKDVEEAFYKLKASYKNAVKDQEAAIIALKAATGTARTDVKSCSLERLRPPDFHGEIREYVGWKRLFEEMVKDENEDIALLRLKNAMRGRVSHCLDGFATYLGAWAHLDAMYGNLDMIAHSLIEEIKAIKPIRHYDSKRFSDFANKVREVYRKLIEIGKKSEADNIYILTELQSKLDVEDVNLFHRMHEVKTVDIFSQWLDNEAIIRMRSKSVGNDTQPRAMKAKTLALQENPKPNFQKCWLCQSQDHRIWECQRLADSSVEERDKFVREANACFNCLSKGHRRQDCRRNKTCGKNGCRFKHHPLLHRDAGPPQPKVVSSTAGNTETILPVVKVHVHDQHGDVYEATALLDSGSQQSLISKRLAHKLNLQGKAQTATFCLAGGGLKSERSRALDVMISSCDDDESRYRVVCFEMSTVCSDIRPYDSARLNEFRHLKGLPEHVFSEGGRVDILLGVDVPQVHVDLEVRAGETGPIAKKTPLGWVIIGDPQRVKSSFSINHIQLSRSEYDNLAEFFETESMGVTPKRCPDCTSKTSEDVQFIKVMDESCINVDERFQVRLPWKSDPAHLEDNYEVALRRLQNTERVLAKNGKLRQYYSEQMNALVENGFAREVTPDEKIEKSWYLPHHVVVREDKESTPYRIVFDSASKYKGCSLNDFLLKGPNYMNSLFNVIQRFREEAVAVTGDIKKMFHQIALHPDDQRYHRYLWRDCDSNQEPRVYQMTRVTFGDKSSPDISGYVMLKLARESANNPLTADVLANGRYVDDIAESMENVKDIMKVTSSIDSAIAHGGFSIKKWHSNSKEIDPHDEEHCSVLGYVWNKKTDEISIPRRVGKLTLDTALTKRKVFKIIASLWDPLGLTAAVSVKAKIEMQNLWRLRLAWDDPVNQKPWKEIFNDLLMLSDLTFTRCLKPHGDISDLQLHGFADASEEAYGACVFLRWCVDGEVKCTLVAAKSNVTPLKAHTIPRYELMACVLLVRLFSTLKEALRYKTAKTVLWSDSTTALSWINSQSRDYKPFVQVRISEIQRTFDPNLWRYVPSADNPADELSKGISAKQLESWHRGPSFLKLSESQWPMQPTPSPLSDSNEKKKKKMQVNAAQRKQVGMIEFGRFSQWSRLRNCFAWILRFVKNCRADASNRKLGWLESQELDAAEVHLYRMAQEQIDWQGDTYKKLTPFIDEVGVRRAKGRIGNANLPYEQRHPIILPKDHNIVKMIISKLHKELGHPGHKRVAAELRRHFWIVGDEGLCKRMTRQCVTCRRFRAKPEEQFMADLPAFRIQPNTPAFIHTSVDYFGPLKVLYSRNSVIDAYGCIFTCLTTRAVHIELVTDASTQGFLCAWRRFSAIRGHAKLIVSDNATNFVGAQRFIRDIIEEWNLSEIENFGVSKRAGFQWKTVSPGASHHNGAVERLIRSVRNAINGTCGFVSFREESWRTYLAEVTNLINSRPLYPASSSPLDDPPITPNDLLIGHNNVEVPQIQNVDDNLKPQERFQKVQRQVNFFWTRWMRYFAPSLLVRNKWWKPRENVKVNDVVLIVDKNNPRGRWKMAQVVEVYPSEDERVRSLKLKAWDARWSKHVYFTRPITKICLLVTAAELVDSLESV